jgi:heme A synthase
VSEIDTENPLRSWTAVAMGLLVVQIAFGGLLRHLSLPLAQRLHPMLAFAIAAAVVVILVRMFVLKEGFVSMRWAAKVLAALVALQAVLGVEAWLRHADVVLQYQPIRVGDAVVRSLHVLTGFGVFATAAVLTARAWKAKLI